MSRQTIEDYLQATSPHDYATYANGSEDLCRICEALNKSLHARLKAAQIPHRLLGNRANIGDVVALGSEGISSPVQRYRSVFHTPTMLDGDLIAKLGAIAVNELIQDFFGTDRLSLRRRTVSSQHPRVQTLFDLYRACLDDSGSTVCRDGQVE